MPGVTFPGIGRIEGSNYLNNVGGRQSSNSTTGTAVWTPTNKLVLTARGGYTYLNEKLGNYGVPSVIGQTGAIVNSGDTPPASFGQGIGQNFPSFSQILFDASRRRTFDADASYLVSELAGRHQFKGGIQFNGISNQIQSTTVDTLSITFGPSISVASLSGHSEVPRSPNAIGAGFLQRFGAQGSAASNNFAFYFQDTWQPTSRLTLNLGVRAESKSHPALRQERQAWNSVLAKRSLPGLVLPTTFLAMATLNSSAATVSSTIVSNMNYRAVLLAVTSSAMISMKSSRAKQSPASTGVTIIGSNPDPIGGTCPIPNSSGLSRCQLDFRIPSNLVGMPEFGRMILISMLSRQSEFTIGAEHNLGTDLILNGRYTHEQVDIAVEDVGIQTPGGEAYIIGNPGRGLVAKLNAENDLVNQEPVRDYDAVEVSLNRRFAKNFYFDTSYTWRLDSLATMRVYPF